MGNSEKRGIGRRTFMKYSLSAVAGLAVGPGTLGLLGSQGEASPSGRVQKIMFSTWSRPDLPELGRLLVSSFKEVGVELDMEIFELGAFLDKAIKEHGHALGFLSWTGTMDRLDPSFFLTNFFHSLYSKKGGQNYEHYRNPEYDKVCDAANSEMDVDKRVKLVHKCQEILARDLPFFQIGFIDLVQPYNSEAWENPVTYMGSGVGNEGNIWTAVDIKPRTSRKKLITSNTYDLPTLSLGSSNWNSMAALRMVYDTFLKVGPDLKIVPWAAESWKIVNNTTVDIVLRKGMKFHDGKPVTIEDVKFTFDYMKERKMAMYKQIYDQIEKTEVLSDNAVRIRLVRPYAPFITNSMVFAHILPKHIWEKIGEPDQYPNLNPIGSGPFKFGYWKRNEELYFEANKEHFHAPKLDGIYRKVIPSMDGIIGAYQNKEIDTGNDRLSQEQAEQLSKLPYITITATPNHGGYEMRADLDKKPFSDLAFRRAVSHLIPRKDYMALAFGKYGHAAANSILHPQLKPWFNDKIPFDEFSIEKARAILKAAKYTWDKNGILQYPG